MYFLFICTFLNAAIHFHCIDSYKYLVKKMNIYRIYIYIE